MASIHRDPDGSGCWRVSFRFGGRQYRRSLRTASRAEADAIRGRIEETIALVHRGRIVLPPDADVGTFLMSDGKVTKTPTVAGASAPQRATVGTLLVAYQAGLPDGAKEENSLRTEHIHLGHVKRVLGTDATLESVDLAAAQRYARARGRETHGRNAKRPIRPYTVRKELKSFRHAWAWCHARGLVATAPAWELAEVTLPRDREPEPFRTMAEIRARINRGGLSPAEQRALWDCLYLTGPELMELLAHVRGLPLEGFVFPMFVFAVYTGARRSEMLRSQLHDFELDGGRVQIREKKRVKGRSSSRWVDLHPDLAEIMRAWCAVHPGGPHTLARPDGSPLDVDLMDRRFAAAVRGTKFEVMRGFHVLRHSFASVLASKGVDQRIINAFMGHSSEQMAARYRHLIPDSTRSAILMLTG